MGAIIAILVILLVMAMRLLWTAANQLAEEKTKNLRAQAEIRALEDKLREVNHGN